MTEYLPNVYTAFRATYPEVAGALDALGAASSAAGPLDTRTQRLVKLAIACGGISGRGGTLKRTKGSRCGSRPRGDQTGRGTRRNDDRLPGRDSRPWLDRGGTCRGLSRLCLARHHPSRAWQGRSDTFKGRRDPGKCVASDHREACRVRDE